MNAPPRGFSFFRQAFLQKGRYLPACSGTVLLRHTGHLQHTPVSLSPPQRLFGFFARPFCKKADTPALIRGHQTVPRRPLPCTSPEAPPSALRCVRAAHRVNTTPAPRRPATASPRAAATGKSLKILKRSPV